MKQSSPLSLLERPDKRLLAGGNRLLYSPAFPQHRDHPGCWDEAHYYNYAFRPLFTWSLFDARGDQVPLRMTDALWRPDVLTRTFTPAEKGRAVIVTERLCLLPTDVVVSQVTIRNTGRKTSRYSLAAWTVRDSSLAAGTSFIRPMVEESVFSCETSVAPARRREMRFGLAFTMKGAGVRCALRMSESAVPYPDWRFTPFAEERGRFPALPSIPKVSEGSLTVAFQSAPVALRPRGERTYVIGVATAPTPVEARANLSLALRRRDPVALSTVSWNDHFDEAPQLQASDPHVESAYWYRWFGLRMNTIYGGEGNYEHPAVCEGTGYFRAPISYSAPCHMRENRWMADPDLARGSLLTFIHNQRPDGGFRGYIDVGHYRDEMFYHANWGRALLALEALHPSDEFVRTAYAGLQKYASYFDKERDEEVSGLYDIDNHYETGQEYMRRYTAVSERADEEHWGQVFRLKGVDVTVYLYELKCALAQIAERIGRPQDAELWTMEADRTRDAVRTHMWDPKAGMFFDVDPATGNRTGVKASTCFYPYFTDIVDESHLPGLKRHLLSKREFWSPWPVPSTSMDDETFSAEPFWKGKRMNCPWNGRVWPMTNSHIVDALASTALRFSDRLLERKAAELIRSFIRMLFFDGDPRRPNCFEHYNPLTGAPSIYRGVDDYMHSWVNDIILTHVMGIRPGPFSVTVQPLRMGLARASVRGVTVRGRTIGVTITNKTFRVEVEGERGVEEEMGGKVELQI